MVVDKNSNNTNNSNNSRNTSNNKKVIEAPPSPKAGNDDLDEETRLANLNKLAAKKKGPAPYKAKSPKAPKEPKKGKEKTTWDPFVFGGKGATGEEARSLDRGMKNGGADGGQDGGNVADDTDHQLSQFVPDRSVIGKSSRKIKFNCIKQFEIHYFSLYSEIEAMREEESDEDEFEERSASTAKAAPTSGLWSSLSSLVGQKQLNASDIEPVITKMRDHLIGKNVAADVANKLCESVSAKLEGKVLGTFSSVHRTVKETLTESLLQLLTPKRRVDIIRDVLDAKANRRPYVVTFCGVNGVGKSTNLAKICFWLVENRCRVLIAACDTFR